MKTKTRAEFMRLLEGYEVAMVDSMFCETYRMRIKSAIKSGKFRNQLIDKFAPKK